jgi:anti-sigma B factor antagonist
MTDRSEIPVAAPGYLAEPFSIAVELWHDAVQITPRGELDLATVEQLQHELGQLIDAGSARIVIDLRDLEFMDSTGLHALLTAHEQAQQDNWELTIIPGPWHVQHTFELTGTIDRLPFTAGNGRAAHH